LAPVLRGYLLYGGAGKWLPSCPMNADRYDLT